MESANTQLSDLSLSVLTIALKSFNVTRLVDAGSPIAERVFPRTASLNLTIIRQLKSHTEVFYPIAFFGRYQAKTKKHTRSSNTVELVPFAWMTIGRRLIIHSEKGYIYLELSDLRQCLSDEQLTRLSQSLTCNPVEMVALYRMDAETASSKE